MKGQDKPKHDGKSTEVLLLNLRVVLFIFFEVNAIVYFKIIVYCVSPMIF